MFKVWGLGFRVGLHVVFLGVIEKEHGPGVRRCISQAEIDYQSHGPRFLAYLWNAANSGVANGKERRTRNGNTCISKCARKFPVLWS